MKILVAGSTGQVARALVERAAAHSCDVAAIGRPELDLAEPSTLSAAIKTVAPDIVINAAAYTAVDQAETEPEAAAAINTAGPAALAAATRSAGAPLLHISTDYVYDGASDRPYREDNPTAPLGVYGRTKLVGDEAVLAAGGYVFRTAWVYSPFGKNFVKTMLRLAETRDEVGVVYDQIGNPTSALDIADGLLTAAAKIRADAPPAGVYHLAATGHTSWAGVAETVFDESRRADGPVAAVKRITTAEYPTPTKRPANSRLDTSKLERAFGVVLPAWEPSLRACVSRLIKESQSA
ncbi:MAG: dTDP-4-dehydrorhamnose reductase [Pseudomonadota bacterium]